MDQNKDQNEGYIKLFESERSEWKEKIQVLSLGLKSIKTVAEVQIDLFSQRQVLLEYSYKLAQIVSKMGAKERQTRANKLKEYSQNSDIRYGSNEMKILIEGEVAEIVNKIEMVEGHRKFIDQTIQTVDHMLYGIKSRISLEEYLRGSTIK
jgi:hypothetical protein